MTDQSPQALSDIEILDILQSMKKDELNTEAQAAIRQGGKAGRQEAHKPDRHHAPAGHHWR